MSGNIHARTPTHCDVHTSNLISHSLHSWSLHTPHMVSLTHTQTHTHACMCSHAHKHAHTHTHTQRQQIMVRTSNQPQTPPQQQRQYEAEAYIWDSANQPWLFTTMNVSMCTRTKSTIGRKRKQNMVSWFILLHHHRWLPAFFCPTAQKY